MCAGKLELVDVAKDYVCKDHVGKWKCIKKAFKDEEECEKKCPAKCKGKACQALGEKPKDKKA